MTELILILCVHGIFLILGFQILSRGLKGCSILLEGQEERSLLKQISNLFHVGTLFAMTIAAVFLCGYVAQGIIQEVIL